MVYRKYDRLVNFFSSNTMAEEIKELSESMKIPNSEFIRMSIQEKINSMKETEEQLSKYCDDQIKKAILGNDKKEGE